MAGAIEILAALITFPLLCCKASDAEAQLEDTSPSEEEHVATLEDKLFSDAEQFVTMEDKSPSEEEQAAELGDTSFSGEQQVVTLEDASPNEEAQSSVTLKDKVVL